nr:glutamate-5-semialdehyde dehydrogenase [Parachlamydiaceae bacterium]
MTKTCNIKEMGIKAKHVVALMAKATSAQKNKALEILAHLLISEQDFILEANRIDVASAKASGMNEAMLDRLSLEGRLAGIAADVQQVIKLPDPVREVIEDKMLPNGLHLCKKRTPIGVLGVIYEARPNVTVDVSVLTIKTGNCVILRGGSETVHSNAALLKVVHKALKQAELPLDAVQLVMDPDRKYVTELLKLHESIDLIIPRGGANLHKFCRENSTIPVITGGIGICHIFVDESANQDKILDVIFNAKTQRPTVCNALDTLLVHYALAQQLIPLVITKLACAGVNFQLDERAMQSVAGRFQGLVKAATAKDWDTEWL